MQAQACLRDSAAALRERVDVRSRRPVAFKRRQGQIVDIVQMIRPYCLYQGIASRAEGCEPQVRSRSFHGVSDAFRSFVVFRAHRFGKLLKGVLPNEHLKHGHEQVRIAAKPLEGGFDVDASVSSC